jgi:hypothetical protein
MDAEGLTPAPPTRVAPTYRAGAFHVDETPASSVVGRTRLRARETTLRGIVSLRPLACGLIRWYVSISLARMNSPRTTSTAYASILYAYGVNFLTP